MKRKIFVFTVLLLTLVTAVLSTACVGSWRKVEPLKDYDFSIDNVVEVRVSSSPMYRNLHGTIYGVKKGDSQESDEVINDIARIWESLQRDAVFKKGKKLNLFLATGGMNYYECIFADGSSVKMTKDVMDNLFFNDGSSVRIDFDYKLNAFQSRYDSIMQEENVIGHISQQHDDNCDCDLPPAQR